MPSRQELWKAFSQGIWLAVGVGLAPLVGLLGLVPVVRETKVLSGALLVAALLSAAVFWIAEIVAVYFGFRGLLRAKESVRYTVQAVTAFAYVTMSVGFILVTYVGVGSALKAFSRAS